MTQRSQTSPALTHREIKDDDVPAIGLWAELRDIENLEKLITLPAFWGVVLESDNSLLGFAYGWRLDSDVEVIQITVHPDHRRLGYGKILLDYFIDAAGANICRLEVRADNVAALSLYEGYGFTKDSIRANYYDDERGKIDAVLMTYAKANGIEN